MITLSGFHSLTIMVSNTSLKTYENVLILGIHYFHIIYYIICNTIEMAQRILPKFIMINNRGSKTNCQICNVKFQLLVKQEHQCKRCMRAVCEQCGPERRMVYESDGSSSPHRTCLICIKQIDILEAYNQEYKLSFGQDSEFVEDWINKLNKQRRDYESILNQYSEYSTGVNNDNVIRFKRESHQVFNDLMESYNYSFRNFIKIITSNINGHMFQSKVSNVMIAIYARVKALPYVVDLIYVAIFFLCFANEAHTYFIISRLIEKVYPQYVRVKKMKKDNLLQSSLKTILEMYKICLTRVDRNQLEVVAQYLENRFNFYIVSFSLNVCSLPASFFILDQMLKNGNYLPLYKGIASLIANCRQELSSYETYSDVELALIKNVTLDKLKTLFITIQKTDLKFEINNDLFDSAEHRKLHEKYKQMQILYSKSEKTLADKEKQLKQMSTDLHRQKSQVHQLKKKIVDLQSELLHVSDNLPKLTNYMFLEENYEKIRLRNIQLENKCAELERKAIETEKLKLNYENYQKKWDKVEDNYARELAELRTKNQIMSIQLAARQIDFNTAYIERKLQQKNTQIKILNQELSHLKKDLEYYKLKVLQKSFSLKNHGNGNQLFPGMSEKPKDKDNQFQKYIDNTKQLVASLNQEKQQIKARNSELELKGFLSAQKIRELEDKLDEVSEISKILKQIPNEYSYEDSIEQLDRMIQKQSNFMKKQSLEDIKQKFERCSKEVKFRIIDTRLKQQKIRNSPLLAVFSEQNLKRFQKDNQQSSSILSNFIDNIDKSQQNQVIQGPDKKQCLIM